MKLVNYMNQLVNDISGIVRKNMNAFRTTLVKPGSIKKNYSR